MCLIVRTNKDIHLTDDILASMHDKNSDGYGFMYVKNGKLTVEKNHENDLAAFIDAYRRLIEFNPVIHLRMRTHGDIDNENTHPYEVNYGMQLMHNGIINFTSNEQDKTKSDTWHFINKYLNPLLDQAKHPSGLIRNQAFLGSMSSWLNGQRVVIGDNKGFVFIGSFHEMRLECMKGLIISNTYAWPGEQYRTPEQREADYQKRRTQGNVTTYYGQPAGFTDEEMEHTGTAPPSHLLLTGQGGKPPMFTHIKKSLYADLEDRVWKWTGVGFIRKAKFDTVWLARKRALASRTSTASTGMSSKSLIVPSNQSTTPPQQLQLLPTSPTQWSNPTPKLPSVGVINTQVSSESPKAPGPVTTLSPEAYRLLVRATLDGGDDEMPSVRVEMGTPPRPTLPNDSHLILPSEVTPEQSVAALLAEWKQAAKHSINGMVYTDPDNAATLLEHFLR